MSASLPASRYNQLLARIVYDLSIHVHTILPPNPTMVVAAF